MTGKLPDNKLIGVVWPENFPGIGGNSDLYGHAELFTNEAVEAGSLQTLRLVYTAGKYGIDDTGSIRVVFRFANDGGKLQIDDPAGLNYVSGETNTGAWIDLQYHDMGHQRPWFKSLTARLHGGFLRQGDTISIVFGDTRMGSPGMKMQSFCDSNFEFRVLTDVCAVGHYIPLTLQPSLEIVPGEPVIWKAVLPSLRRPGEKFQLGIKAEDRWGNPTDQASGKFRLKANQEVKGLPEVIEFNKGDKALTIENLSVDKECELRICLKQGESCIANAGPLLIKNGKTSGYWGDLHGQSAESLGTGTARQYFEFARNFAFLDLVGHQANDFQVTTPFWKQLNSLTAEFLEEGRFVTFPGYEWSGNTGVGGDRNVYFKSEGRQIHRSSHALLSDRSDIETDAADAEELFKALAGEDCVVYAHVGGRYADIKYAHDPRIETAMEIHSAWGTFEWLLTDGFELGHRSGVVCNSDGHKGRPGASYPGASKFGAYGGLTCFLAEELSRDAIFECLRKRHHYGTTGCRMHLDVQVQFPEKAVLYERDPAVFPDTGSSHVYTVMMGDIVKTEAHSVSLRVEASAHTPIERMEIRNGKKVIKTIRSYTKEELGPRIKIIWSGAEYRGRGRETQWSGKARFENCAIKRFSRINHWNLERKLEQTSSDTVEWNTLTTGNFGGFDVIIDEKSSGKLVLDCNHGSINMDIADIGFDDIELISGGLDRKIRIFRLPETNHEYSLSISEAINLTTEGDNPLWVCVTTEDGFQAWSSPIFVIPFNSH